MRRTRKFSTPRRMALRSSLRRRPRRRSTPIKLCSGWRAAYWARKEPSPLPSSISSGWRGGKRRSTSSRSMIEARGWMTVVETGSGFKDSEFEVFQGAGGAVGGHAERFAQIDGAGAQGDFSAGDGGVDNFFVVEPGLDFGRGDAKEDVIPAVGVKVQAAGGLVFGGVLIVETGEADDAATPAAQNQAAGGVGHGKGQAAEEIAAVHFHGVEANLVTGAGQQSIGPGYAAQFLAHEDFDLTVLDIYLAVDGEIGDGPIAEGDAIEKGCPVGGPMVEAGGLGEGRGDGVDRAKGGGWAA